MKDIDNIITIFNCLDDYYGDALEYIGFRPSILQSMYSRAGYMEGELEIDQTVYAIESAYDGSTSHPEEEYASKHNIPGLSILDDPFKKVLYSVESFIKVLKEDL